MFRANLAPLQEGARYGYHGYGVLCACLRRAGGVVAAPSVFLAAVRSGGTGGDPCGCFVAGFAGGSWDLILKVESIGD